MVGFFFFFVRRLNALKVLGACFSSRLSIRVCPVCLLLPFLVLFFFFFLFLIFFLFFVCFFFFSFSIPVFPFFLLFPFFFFFFFFFFFSSSLFCFCSIFGSTECAHELALRLAMFSSRSSAVFLRL